MAKSVSVTIPHKLSKDEARVRVANGFQRMKGQIANGALSKFEESWTGDQLAFSARGMGQTIKGRIDVGDADVRIGVELPMLLAGLAGQVEEQLREQGTALLDGA